MYQPGTYQHTAAKRKKQQLVRIKAVNTCERDRDIFDPIPGGSADREEDEENFAKAAEISKSSNFRNIQ